MGPREEREEGEGEGREIFKKDREKKLERLSTHVLFGIEKVLCLTTLSFTNL